MQLSQSFSFSYVAEFSISVLAEVLQPNPHIQREQGLEGQRRTSRVRFFLLNKTRVFSFSFSFPLD